MNYEIEITDFGFRSVKPLPSQAELENHYREKYFQVEGGSYQHEYSDDECTYFEIESKVADHLFKKFGGDAAATLLDVGAGEGYFSKYFFENDWTVTACDFSTDGMTRHNPALLPSMVQGNLFDTLDQLNKQQRSYGFVNLKNILEHVIDPVALLNRAHTLLESGALLRIEVPNDYSAFQNMLLDQNMTTDTWFAPPEHLHYFNVESLKKLLVSQGYNVELVMTDFAVELFLLNEHSNYTKHKERGKEAHLARVRANNYIYERGIENYIRYFSACADVDLGRQIIIYATKA